MKNQLAKLTYASPAGIDILQNYSATQRRHVLAADSRDSLSRAHVRTTTTAAAALLITSSSGGGSLSRGRDGGSGSRVMEDLLLQIAKEAQNAKLQSLRKAAQDACGELCTVYRALSECVRGCGRAFLPKLFARGAAACDAMLTSGWL